MNGADNPANAVERRKRRRESEVEGLVFMPQRAWPSPFGIQARFWRRLGLRREAKRHAALVARFDFAALAKAPSPLRFAGAVQTLRWLFGISPALDCHPPTQ
jgi:hypothetical protein